MKYLKNITFLILLTTFFQSSSFGNVPNEPSIFFKKFEFKKLYVLKSGSYIGLQQGKYQAIEFGQELQWKRIKLKNSRAYAGNFGFDYDFKERVIGFKTGFWFKKGKFNLTYGVNGVYRSNFSKNRIGGGPVIGFKIIGLHLQTGYNFLTESVNFTNTNQLYISLRYVFISSRDYKLK